MISIGARLGSCEIVSPLGAGGLGACATPDYQRSIRPRSERDSRC
jgi:hypothetical protein